MSQTTLRDFVKLPDGRVGMILANDTCGGVFRGHYKIWFGEVKDGAPVVEHLCGAKDWQVVKATEKPL